MPTVPQLLTLLTVCVVLIQPVRSQPPVQAEAPAQPPGPGQGPRSGQGVAFGASPTVLAPWPGGDAGGSATQRPFVDAASWPGSTATSSSGPGHSFGDVTPAAYVPHSHYAPPSAFEASAPWISSQGNTVRASSTAFSPGAAPGGFSTPYSDPAPAFLSNTLRLDPTLTEPLLDFQNRQADKELLLMVPSPGGMMSPSVTLGGQMRVSAMAATVSHANRFSYLGRFPPDFVGKSATDVRMTQASAAAVASFTPWAHGYAETMFSDVFTFPSFNQGSFQMRQAYVTFGDLTEVPWYAFMGKKTVSFGDMGTLSPFSQSMVWHYFAPLAEGAGVGYAADGFNASVTALNGSRGIRVADSEERGHLNNFAANARYQMDLDDVSWLAVGAGYLHGTIYDGAVAEHTNSNISGPRNGAWDVNLCSKMGPWRAEYEITSTVNAWPVSERRVMAYRAEGAYDMTWMQHPLRLSGSWSEGRQGPNGSEYEFNKQVVAGLRYDPHPNVMISLEYIRSMGFAPLINLTTVSERDASQNTFLLGIVLNI